MITDDLAALATPIDQLELLDGNPRRGDVDAVARSLDRFGQRKPIVARKSDRQVVAGNHTLQAARKLGWSEIAVVWVDDDEVTAKAFALADNRTAELGDYDDQLLAKLVAEVRAADEEMLADAGWHGDDLAELLAKLEPAETFTDPDDVPAAPIEKSVPGDVWILGPHRLLCGDATSPTDYERLIDGSLVDCVFTDPPYNVAYEGGTADKLKIQNDDMSDAAFDAFLMDSFVGMSSAMRPGAAIYVCHADGSGNAFRNSFVGSGLLLKQVLIWVKQRFVLGRQDYNWQHEPILYGWKPGAAHQWHGPHNRSTVLDDTVDLDAMGAEEMRSIIADALAVSTVVRVDNPRRNGDHPTMKPVALIERLVANSTRPGQLVLDPFGGSGSTLIACHQTNRVARLIELDPKYVDVICRRFQEHTGIKPIAEATGREHDFTKDK